MRYKDRRFERGLWVEHERIDLLPQASRGYLIEMDKWFVHQEDGGRCCKRPCYSDPLPHPTAHFFGIVILNSFEPDDIKHFFRDFGGFFVVDFFALECQLDVIQRSHPWES